MSAEAILTLSSMGFATYMEFAKTVCRHVGKVAVYSMVQEAAVFPKPGLVTPYSNGAHRDMNFTLMCRSALSLENYFCTASYIGFVTQTLPVENVFRMLRRRGQYAEKTMFMATKQVNTHKGLVFSLGLFCAAVGRLYAKKQGFNAEKLCRMAGSFAKGLCQADFAQGNASQNMQTAGGKLYRRHAVRGARGEAEDGFPNVLKGFLQFREFLKDGTTTDAAVNTLLWLMSKMEDTNVLHRAGHAGLQLMQERASDALAIGGVFTEHGKLKVAELCKLCEIKNISPGGSADLLAMAIFIHSMESNYRISPINAL